VQLGQLANLDRDYSTAERHYAEAWHLIREIGDPEEEAAVLNNLGDNAARRGDGPRAIGYYERSLAISRALDHPEGIAAKLVNLAEARLLVGDAASALMLADEGVARYRALGNREHLADALYVLGLIQTAANDQVAAFAALREAVDLFHAVGNVASAGQTLDLLGGVAARLGDAATAARWLGAGEAMRRRVGANPYPPSGYEGIVADVQRSVDEVVYAREFAAGAAQSDAQIRLDVATYAPPTAARLAPETTVPLTARQEEILRLVGQGSSNRDIGRTLGISVRTVERHLTEIYTALGVTRRTEAVARAIRRVPDSPPPDRH
jgi:ATP/maltotriose-dependent transcriptional regulator MalT